MFNRRSVPDDSDTISAPGVPEPGCPCAPGASSASPGSRPDLRRLQVNPALVANCRRRAQGAASIGARTPRGARALSLDRGATAGHAHQGLPVYRHARRRSARRLGQHALRTARPRAAAAFRDDPRADRARTRPPARGGVRRVRSPAARRRPRSRRFTPRACTTAADARSRCSIRESRASCAPTCATSPSSCAMLAWLEHDFDFRVLTREAFKYIPMELDFVHEADNCETIARNLAARDRRRGAAGVSRVQHAPRAGDGT